MSKAYVPDGVWLTCTCGSCFSQLKVRFNSRSQIYSARYASEGDRWPFLNIKPMGFCAMKAAMLAPLCVPSPVFWMNPKQGVTVGSAKFKVLLEDSTALCMYGGTIRIHFSKEAAMAAAPWGSFKKPSQYISDFFTWAIDGTKEGLGSAKGWLAEKGAPQWLLDSADGLAWYVEFEFGVVEGAINAVVGLVEVVYDITQDPVGIGEAIVVGACDGAKGALKWVSKGDNWKNAANDTWDFVSDPNEWEKAKDSAVDWVKKNPRTLGNVAGEIVETVAEIVFTAGTATAAKVGSKVAKEVVEEVTETVVQKGGKELVEKTGKEAGEKVVKETVEEAAEKEGGKVARVVTKKEKLKPGSPEHKAARWEAYKKKHPNKSYEEWSNRYEANMKNAKRGNKSADDYQKKIGWGKREVPIKDEHGKIIRKLDIADEKAKKAIEMKDYSKNNVPYSKEIKNEVAIDKKLVEEGWDVEWVFKDKGPSKGLEEALNAPPPIKITKIE